MEELRECPCGNEAHLIFEDGTKVADPWSVACKNFDCPWVFQTFPTKEEAVKHWNTRATDPLLKETEMEVGKRYVVTKPSDDGTFEIGDHISMNADGSINDLEAQGWIDSCDVDEATKGMEVEIDKQWVEQRKKKLLEELASLNA